MKREQPPSVEALAEAFVHLSRDSGIGDFLEGLEVFHSPAVLGERVLELKAYILNNAPPAIQYELIMQIDTVYNVYLSSIDIYERES